MNREKIEILLKRYLDGDTTNEEEKLLRRYFTATQIVPKEWEPYKALFCWEASQQHPLVSDNATPAHTLKEYRMAIVASIAALLLVGAGMTAMLLYSLHTEQQTVHNYAVLDGCYTTDAAVIAYEAEEALLLVAATDEETFDAIDILATP